MRLTDISIQKIKPTDKQVVYYDDQLANFGIRVGKRSKTFIVKVGKNRSIKSIGKYPSTSLKDARLRAKNLLLDTYATLPNQRYSGAIKSFLEDAETRNRPETIRQYKRHLEAFDSKKKLADITRAEIKVHLKDYADKKSAHAHAVAALRVFFNWCIRQELISKHPLAGERLIPVAPRTRVLTLEELRTIYAYNFPHFSTILKLAILTGQRRSEIASIQPDWIGEDTLTFPASVTKNKREHTLPITGTMSELLADIPFKENGTWNGWSNGKKRIDKQLKLPHWQIHDIRRSFSTVMASIGVEIHLVEKLLNHSTGTLTPIAQVYNKYSYLPEMKVALEKFEAHVLPS